MGRLVLPSDASILKDAGVFPLIRTKSLIDASPWTLFQRIATTHRPSFLLESGKGSWGSARYSFLASDPYLIFSGGPGYYTVETARGKTRHQGDPLTVLFEFLRPSLVPRSPFLPPFIGGAVGYMSYDVVRHYEPLPSLAVDDLPLPDLEFLFFDLMVVIDHQTQSLHVMFTPAPDRLLSESHEALHREGTARMAELDSRLSSPCVNPSGSPILASTMEGTHSEREYVERVQRCQAFIGAGDIYQANLAQRFSVAFDPAEDHALHTVGQNLYHRLRTVNPSPFAGLFVTGQLALVS